MSGVTEAQVLEALKTVIEPKRGQDIVTLEMVGGVVVREGNVGFAIEVDPREGHRVFVALLDAPSRFLDAERLLDWAFESYVWPEP